MRIYIDESGGFVHANPAISSFSLVLALVVPSSCEHELFYEFLRLRDTWPEQKIEIKGSSINEMMAAQLIGMLSRFDILVDFTSVDMAQHPPEVVGPFKEGQAQALTAHITREHQPEMVFESVALENAIRAMSNQLFVQAFVTMRLVLKIIRLATLYFVQRQPAELGHIAWVIDRKNRTITEMERVWTTIVLPISENHFMREPFEALEGADYSFFEASYMVDTTVDKRMAQHVAWARSVYGQDAGSDKRVIAGRRLIKGDQRFADSREELGLQLADMLATILRRALNGRLQEAGWRDVGKLLVNEHEPSWFVQLGPTEPRKPGPEVHRVWRAVKRKSKSMLID